MGVIIHLLEIAALLAVAYSLGWLVGYVAHMIAARPSATVPAIPAERIAAATGNADALVKAPEISPVVDPAVPAPVFVAEAAAPIITEAESIRPSMPSDIAASTDDAPVIAAPTPDEKLVAIAAELAAMSGDVPPPPMPTISDVPEAVAEQAPLEIAPVPEQVPVESAPDAEITPVEDAPVEAAALVAPTTIEDIPAPAMPLPPEAIEATEKRLSRFARFRPKPAPAPVPQPEPIAAAPTLTAMPSAKPGEAWSGEIRGRSASAPATKSVPDAPVSEDDAMRAIEGGWSRVRARAMPAAPELADLGVAVAAAQVAVEQVLARSGVEPSVPGHKPRGLLRPRMSGKDDLRRITGLGELDESTLNNFGIFHYDQIAAWTEADVKWMEGHAFAPGRIARESWQEQARSLSVPR